MSVKKHGDACSEYGRKRLYDDNDHVQVCTVITEKMREQLREKGNGSISEALRTAIRLYLLAVQ